MKDLLPALQMRIWWPIGRKLNLSEECMKLWPSKWSTEWVFVDNKLCTNLVGLESARPQLEGLTHTHVGSIGGRWDLFSWTLMIIWHFIFSYVWKNPICLRLEVMHLSTFSDFIFLLFLCLKTSRSSNVGYLMSV